VARRAGKNGGKVFESAPQPGLTVEHRLVDRDAPIDGITRFTTPDCSQWLGQEIGYAPISSHFISYVPPIKEGVGYLDTNNGSASVHRNYAIGFQGPGLIDGSGDTENLHQSPGTWNSDSHNCVHEVIKAAKAVGIQLPSLDFNPEGFGFNLPPDSP
jgi:hypothetical protein